MEEKEKKSRFKSFRVDDTIYKTYLTKKYIERKPYEPDNPNKLYSFIPGTILKMLVKEGQKVKKNDTLLILEAMKMENEIRAQKDTKIDKIHVKAGDSVEGGMTLISFSDKR